jgi:hypothetical protein
MLVPDPKQIVTNALEPNGALDPLAATLLGQAAKGDLTAQRRIRQCWIEHLDPEHPKGSNRDLMAASGLFVARMCAENGGHSDAAALAELLIHAAAQFYESGRIGVCNQLAAEGLSLFERLSAVGDLDAAEAVDKLVPIMPPEVVAQAQTYARSKKEQSDA